MGTNYYLHRNVCQHCGRSDEPLHIGKSSGGWCFSLHVLPDDGISTLADWQREWSKPGAFIKNEYGDIVVPDEMLSIITERSWGPGPERCEQFYRDNYAQPGPANLVRHKIDGRHCIGHGKGTWDLMAEEFS